MTSGGELSHEFLTPYMPHYPEWRNLISRDMDISVDVSSAHKTDPYAEFKRSLAGLYALDNLLPTEQDDSEPDAISYDHFLDYPSEEAAYEAFVDGQDEARQLPLYKYSEARELVNRVLYTPLKARRMQFEIIIADSFKNPVIMRAFGWTPGMKTHDTGIGRLFDRRYEAARRRYFSTIDSAEFSDADRDHFRQFTELAAFNMAGWAQSQASVSSLRPLEGLGREETEEYLLHFFFDVMGVRGNESLTSALAYDEPTHDMLMHAFQALTFTASELGLPPDMDMTLALREEVYLNRRAYYYGVSPKFFESKAQSVIVPEEFRKQGQDMVDRFIWATELQRINELYAQVRIANGARFVERDERFAILREAYAELGQSATIQQTNILSIVGSHYHFDYGPALIRQILGSDKESMKRGLIIMSDLFGKIQAAQNTYPAALDLEFNTLPEEFDYPTDITIALKGIVEAMKQPDFNMGRFRITATYHPEGNVVIPRLAPVEE